jgi:hypothetical protein
VGGEFIQSLEGTTQGDPLGLAIYAIGTQPLVQRLANTVKQVWYADDSAAGSNLEKLRQWWSDLSHIGPTYGYYPNSSKTKLLVKSDFLNQAKEIFGDTGVQICTEGGKYLGGSIGNDLFQQTFIKDKVTEWVKELETLVTVAQTQPHAAYASFTHGVMAKWNYVLRVTKLEESSLNLLQPLEHAIRTCFFPSLTGQSAPNDLLRELLALPPKLGGLGLVNPINSAAQQYQSSCTCIITFGRLYSTTVCTCRRRFQQFIAKSKV